MTNRWQPQYIHDSPGSDVACVWDMAEYSTVILIHHQPLIYSFIDWPLYINAFDWCLSNVPCDWSADFLAHGIESFLSCGITFVDFGVIITPRI